MSLSKSDYAFIIHGEPGVLPTYPAVRADLEATLSNLSRRLFAANSDTRQHPYLRNLYDTYRSVLDETVAGYTDLSSYFSRMLDLTRNKIRIHERRVGEAQWPRSEVSASYLKRLKNSRDYFQVLNDMLSGDVEEREVEVDEGVRTHRRQSQEPNIVNVTSLHASLDELVYSVAADDYGWSGGGESDLDLDGAEGLEFDRTFAWLRTRGRNHALSVVRHVPVQPVSVKYTSRLNGERQEQTVETWAAYASTYSDRERFEKCVTSNWHPEPAGPSRSYLVCTDPGWYEARWKAGSNLRYAFDFSSSIKNDLRRIISWLLNPEAESPGTKETVARLDYEAAENLRIEDERALKIKRRLEQIKASPKLAEFYEPERGLWTLHHVRASELSAEGECMDNCIGNYQPEVARGDMIFLSARLDGVPKISARLDIERSDNGFDVAMVDGQLQVTLPKKPTFTVNDVRGVGNMNSGKWIKGITGLAAILGYDIDKTYIKLKEDHEDPDDEEEAEEEAVVEVAAIDEDEDEDGYDEDEDDNDDDEDDEEEEAPAPRRPIRRPVPAERRV